MTCLGTVVANMWWAPSQHHRVRHTVRGRRRGVVYPSEDPGLRDATGTNSYFFTARDAFARRPDDARISRSTTGRGSKSDGPEVFAQFQLLNLFNQFQFFNISGERHQHDGADGSRRSGCFAFFNPFTETPVEGVHWKKGDKFGKATSAARLHAAADVQVLGRDAGSNRAATGNQKGPGGRSPGPFCYFDNRINRSSAAASVSSFLQKQNRTW